MIPKIKAEWIVRRSTPFAPHSAKLAQCPD
jgi:hypothetical protein